MTSDSVLQLHQRSAPRLGNRRGGSRLTARSSRDGRLFIVGYGTQRCRCRLHASTPRRASYGVDVSTFVLAHGQEPATPVGNTLISPGRNNKPQAGHLRGSVLQTPLYEHPVYARQEHDLSDPVRLVLHEPATVPCQAWDKKSPPMWTSTLSTGSPESKSPPTVPRVRGWMSTRARNGRVAWHPTGFLTNTGERVGLEALNEACASWVISGNCRVVESYTLQNACPCSMDVIGGESGLSHLEATHYRIYGAPIQSS